MKPSEKLYIVYEDGNIVVESATWEEVLQALRYGLDGPIQNVDVYELVEVDWHITIIKD